MRSRSLEGVVTMRHIAFAVLLLLLEIGGRLSASNVGNVISVSAGDTPSQSGSEVTNASACPAGHAKQGSCGQENPRGITYATTTLDWKQAISKSAIGGSAATVRLTPCPVGIDTKSDPGYHVLINNTRPEIVSVGGETSAAGWGSGTTV